MKFDDTVIFICEANALKSKIILENIIEEKELANFNLVTLCNGLEGSTRNYCIDSGIEVISVDNKLESHIFVDIEERYPNCVYVLLGWPYIISSEVVSLLSGRLINCHGSYLPDYRGSRAYMHYWSNIESYYGATIHYVTDKVDDGNILMQRKIKLFLEETPEILHYRTSEILAMMLPKAIEKVLNKDAGFEQVGLSRYFIKQNREYLYNLRQFNELNLANKNISEFK
ncbi:formyltransferase family protein [Vibrio breoganii]|uniref:formyltransferase family protein n=1 Tax=Vibrio breoganii TaxID=553239 RepID=UPI000C818085|nr:formyltransferase family protein [Vibrio breoganii]PMG83495.1 hypothetical protein BCU81_15035 [Vibrio breoganii]